MRRLLAVSAALAVSAFATGCIGFDLSNTTAGEEDNLAFGYASDEFLGCLFGCPVDHPVLAGAHVRIDVFGTESDAKLTARAKGAGAEVNEFTSKFSCSSKKEDGSIDTRDVEENEACAEDEERDVRRGALIFAPKAGTFKLEILDDSGDVVDSLAVEVGEPARATIQRDQQTDVSLGVTLTTGGNQLFEVALFDAKGHPLQTVGDGTTWSSEDPTIVAVQDAAEDAFGAEPNIVLQGVKAGSTTVTLHTEGFSQALPVTVMGE